MSSSATTTVASVAAVGAGFAIGGPAGAMIAGSAVSAYGQYQSAKAQAKTAKNQADAKELEASKLLERAAINAQATERTGKEVEAQQISSFIASGVEIDGTPLSVLEDTADKISRQIALDMEAAEFDAEQMRRGAQFTRESAKQMEKNALIGAIGTVAVGGMQASTMKGKA